VPKARYSETYVLHRRSTVQCLRTYGSLSLTTDNCRTPRVTVGGGGPGRLGRGEKPGAAACRSETSREAGGTAWRLDPDSDALVPAQSLPLRPPACVPSPARARGQKLSSNQPQPGGRCFQFTNVRAVLHCTARRLILLLHDAVPGACSIVVACSVRCCMPPVLPV